MKTKIMGLILGLILLPLGGVLGESIEARIIHNGKEIEGKLMVDGDSSYISIEVLEDLDLEYKLLENGKISLVDKNSREITMNLEGEGENKYISLRQVAENFAYGLSWDGKNKIIILNSPYENIDVANTYLYINEDKAYTLNLPNEWKKSAIVQTWPNGDLYVYDKATISRFIEDNSLPGPVFEIRSSDYPVTLGMDYEDNRILTYSESQYITVLFDYDFQFYPETLESYKKLKGEGLEVLKSFQKIEDEENDFIKDSIEHYEKEVKILEGLLENFLGKDIFKVEETESYLNPKYKNRLLYNRNLNENGDVSIKMEVELDPFENIRRYHIKEYEDVLEKNKISQEEALKLANDFVGSYVEENTKVIKKVDLYPSLYEEGKHESYGDENGAYVLVVDLEKGIVEYFEKIEQ